MTIAEARQMSADELAVTAEHVAQAQAKATELEQAATALEQAAVRGGSGAPKPSAVGDARLSAEFAQKNAAQMAADLKRAQDGQRLLALDQVSSDIQALAARTLNANAGMLAATRKIADGAAELRALAAEHDQQVGDLARRARELGAEPPAPSGPRASSAHVTVFNAGSGVAPLRGVQAGNTTVQPVSHRVADVIGLAVSGDPDKAAAVLSAAHIKAPPKRADRYYIGSGGTVHGIDDGTPTAEQFARQAARREIRQLTDSEVDAYLDGRLDGHQPTTA